MLQIISSVLCQINLDDGSDICSKILKLKAIYLSFPLGFIRSVSLVLHIAITLTVIRSRIRIIKIYILLFCNTSEKGRCPSYLYHIAAIDEFTFFALRR